MSHFKTGLLSCALALLATPAVAGILAGDVSSYQTIWHGSTPFVNSFGLQGNIEWAVYAPGTFPGGFTPDVAIPSDQFVYAYQAFVIGSAPLSTFSVNLDNEAYNIGTFTGTPDDGDTTIDQYLAPFDSASWYWNGIGAGGTSTGLLFTSPNVPKLSNGGTIDHGSVAGVMPIPSPDSPNVPEPATLTLGAIALVGLGAAAARRRKQRISG